MEINSDFSKRVLVHSDEIPWKASPMQGVERRMLDRIGDEVARATTIVRYAPGSHFSPHVHTGGEEFIVLEGVFSDEHGDFPAGSYIRNPPSSSHSPGSKPGCIIFVKLWQFSPSDRTAVKIDINKMHLISDAKRPGVSVMPLFQDEHETVQVEDWEAETEIEMETPDGAELLVLSGTLKETGDAMRQHSWLRIPTGGKISAKAGPNGARLWIKSRHLRDIKTPNQII